MTWTRLFAALMLLACTASQSTLTSTAQLSRHSSPAGTLFTLVRMPEKSRISLNLAWSTHWAWQDANNQAVPFIGAELLLGSETDGYSPGSAGELFARMHAEGQLIASVDHLFGSFTFAPEHAQRTLEIANAQLLQPPLTSDRFQRIKNRFGARIGQLQQLPAQRGFAAVRWAIYGDTPLRQALSLDVPGMIEAVTVDDVARWQAATVGRNNAQIVIAGDLDGRAAGAMVDQLLMGLPHITPVKPAAVAGDFSPRRILLHQPDADVSTLALIGRLPPMRHGGEFDDIILFRKLGGDQNSVLSKALKDRIQSTATVGAGIDAFTRQERFLVLSGHVEARDLSQAEMVVREAYRSFLDKPAMGSLDNVRQSMMDSIARAAKEPTALAQSALFALLDGRDPGIALELDGLLEAVNHRSLSLRLAEAFPAADQWVVIAVSAEADALEGACVITAPAQAADC